MTFIPQNVFYKALGWHDLLPCCSNNLGKCCMRFFLLEIYTPYWYVTKGSCTNKNSKLNF